MVRLPKFCSLSIVMYYRYWWATIALVITEMVMDDQKEDQKDWLVTQAAKIAFPLNKSSKIGDK